MFHAMYAAAHVHLSSASLRGAAEYFWIKSHIQTKTHHFSVLLLHVIC